MADCTNRLTRTALPKGSCLLQQLPFSAKAFLLSSWEETLFVITPAGKEDLLAQEIAAFSARKTLVVPAEEEDDPDSLGRRLEAIAALAEADGPLIVIASPQSACSNAPSLDQLVNTTLTLRVGQKISLTKVEKELIALGYIPTELVSEKQEMALRGGIIDCFAINSPAPFRIEWWGDEIASIRSFDPGNQKSLEKRQECTLVGKAQKSTGTLTDYFSGPTVFDDLVTIEDLVVQFFGSTDPLKAFLKNAIFFSEEPISQISDSYTKGGKVVFQWLGETIHAEALPCSLFAVPDLETLLDEKVDCWFATSNESDIALIQKQAPHAHFFSARLETGFYDPAAHLALIPSHFITHRKFLTRRENRFVTSTPASDLLHLENGDLVVHLQHGIGKYRGVETRPNHLGIASEFFALEYAGGAKCLVPIDRAWELTRYVGDGDSNAPLHEIGNNKWSKQKAKSLTAINVFAKQLVDSTAARSISTKEGCATDSALMQQFERDFPYTATDDQLHAIDAIKQDLCSKACMDRLIAGDVGFGKTEVAMRAAFKAVVDGGKQVVVLAPTTILTLQHFESFTQRMAGFPVRVGQISRFVKNHKAILADVAAGKIDIIIGTHRLLSDDVVFKNLGLLIIDEEQRFGVKAKEKLRALKEASIDCLSLSATPIPRTLYLSLAGARELSTINTPPHDRIPIRTLIEEDEDETIRVALLRELGRGGQAFFIHNRVETIAGAKTRIETLVPQAKVLIAHGQMDSEAIDEVFHAFKNGAANVLLATSIIENGIDIPNANTILIDRADRFGLSELHQLRGRVGRWNKKAWCYFLIPKQQALSEIAYQRLEAIANATGLGAGLKIAMRDLEIRGAGNLIGTEQSGHMASIGFHLYCKLLKKAVDHLHGHEAADLPDVRLDLKIDARLPASYIDAQSLRLEIYQRTGSASSLEEIDALFTEIEDRFGKLPLEAQWLKTLTRLRVRAALAGVTFIRQGENSLLIESEKANSKTSRTVLFKAPKTPLEYEAAVCQNVA